MAELHQDLREAQQALKEAGIQAVRQGDHLVQYEPGIVGLYTTVRVDRLADGSLAVDGRTPEQARRVLTERGFRVRQPR